MGPQHVPSLSPLVFEGPDRRPIGLRILARRHDDRALFGWARWTYRALTS
jgi:Asp-tRNA(Asn)/Glu-tRNA(Gln) amidotransferase A subunit family amidase